MAALIHGLTFEEYCARRLKLSRFHVHQVLSGKRQSAILMDRIAEDLGVAVGDIVQDHNPTNPLWPA